jgi:hypothetical protein
MAIVLNIINAECRNQVYFTECRYAKWQNVECHYAKCRGAHFQGGRVTRIGVFTV